MNTMDKIKIDKAIVTGGAGFVGSHIIKKLLAGGSKVVCIDNMVSGSMANVQDFMSNPNFKLVTSNITNYPSIEEEFNDTDVVFHQAASKATVCLRDPYTDLNSNAKGTYNVLEASRKHGVKKVLYSSTGSVYGEAQYYPQDEDHPLNPLSFYGVSKLAAEKYCNAFQNYYDMDITVLRYFHVFGPNQSYSNLGGVVSIFIRRILNGKPPIIYGTGEQTRSFTFVEDDVDANLFFCKKGFGKGEVYNCASGIKVTINELAHKLLKIMDREDLNPIYKDWRPGDIINFDVSNKKLIDLNFKFRTSFEDGLLKTIEWLKDRV